LTLAILPVEMWKMINRAEMWIRRRKRRKTTQQEVKMISLLYVDVIHPHQCAQKGKERGRLPLKEAHGGHHQQDHH
jgi:hypothetical protein